MKKKPRERTLVEKMFYDSFTLSAIMLLSVMLGVIVDGIVTGRFLGKDAVAASGLLSPVIMIISLAGPVIGNGTKLLVSRYLGMADRQRMNQCFSLGIYAALLLSVLAGVLVWVFAPVLADAVGATGANASLKQLIVDYFRGYAPGFLPLWISVTLTGLMQLDNDGKRAMLAALATFLINVSGDLLNVLVFHGGMLGMAMATTISAYGGMVILLQHFRKEGILLAFTKTLNAEDLKEIGALGGSSAADQISSIIRNFGLNILLLAVAQKEAITAITVSNNFITILVSLTLGYGAASATVAMILMGESDGSSLNQLSRIALKAAFKSAIIATVVIEIAAPIIVRVFLSADAQVLAKATMCLRFMTLSFTCRVLIYPVNGILRSTGKPGLASFFSAMIEGIMPLMCAVPLGLMYAENGVWWSFPISGILSLAILYVVAWRSNGALPRTTQEIAMIPKSLGVGNNTLYERSIHTLDEVMEASETVQIFCREKGADNKTTMLLSLAIEELGGNTVRYGFKDGKSHSMDIRLIKAESGWKLRLRDDGVLFDPVNWLEQNCPEDPTSNIGIRMVLKMANDIEYIPMMKLNNLLINLPENAEP